MAQETNQTQGPMLCTTGCGFYGNPRTNGMCSVCYKDFLQRQNSSERVSPSASSGVSILGESLPAQHTDHDTIAAEAPSEEAAASPEPTSDVSSQTLSQPSAAQSEKDSTGEKAEIKIEPAPEEGTMVSVIIRRPEDGVLSEDVSSSDSESESPVSQPESRKRKRRDSEALEGTSEPTPSETDTASVEGQEPAKPKRSRCFMCRKKVGLTGFDCRCGKVFCGIHRYSDVHNCTFDYKADAAEKIRKENPVVVGEKIQKI